MAQSFYAIRCPLSRSAAVAVVYKLPLKKWAYIIINKVVHNSVSKISRKNFPLEGLESHETNAWADFVVFRYNIPIKLKKFCFIIYFKSQGVVCVALIFSGVKIGLEQII